MKENWKKLKNVSYNPITSKTLIPALLQQDISPSTPFITALEEVEKRISASTSTKRDLKSILKFVRIAATQLRYSELPISNISRKHIKQLLTNIDLFNGAHTQV